MIAVGWDTQMHADVVCEFLIQMGKANNVIILRCVTYLKSHLFNVTYLERFSNDCQKKPLLNLLLRPITTRANSAMNQSEFFIRLNEV